jgi:hypothetical protein
MAPVDGGLIAKTIPTRSSRQSMYNG